MSQRNYQSVARILGTVDNSAERDRLIAEFQRVFSHDNPRFDYSRFREAVRTEHTAHNLQGFAPQNEVAG